MSDWIWVLRALEAAVLLIGTAISYASWKAYSRTGRSSLLWLGAGFALVTMAAALAGVLYEFVTHDLLSAWIASAALDGGGFAIILYSILKPAELRLPAPTSLQEDSESSDPSEGT